MDYPPWRVDPIGDGTLVWLYVRPHEVEWAVPSEAVTALGYTVTEERQCLVDNGLGACIRYLVVHSSG